MNVDELIAAARAWDAARIPKTATSTWRACERLSAALREAPVAESPHGATLLDGWATLVVSARRTVEHDELVPHYDAEQAYPVRDEART